MSARPSFVLDLNRCTGCRACELACQIANALPVGRDWRRVRTFNPLLAGGVELVHLSLACNHCEEAPCAAQCPAKAYYRDPGTGALLIDPQRCLGCRYCAWVCPYDAPRFDAAAGVMTKCTFCIDRQRAGEAPACAAGCPTGALSWDVLSPAEWTPAPEVAGFADAGTRPAIRIRDLRPERRVPDCTHPPTAPPWRHLLDRLEARITLRHEWPLALFTWLLAMAAGRLIAALWGGPPATSVLLPAATAAGLVLTVLHLGRRERSWRAVHHVVRSRLSREIILSGAFLAGGAVWLPLSGYAPAALRWTALLGAAALIAVDVVYAPLQVIGGRRLHSAGVVLAAAGVAAALAGAVGPAALIAAATAGLYLDRKRRRAAAGRPVRPLATVLRCGGALAAVLILVFDRERTVAAAVLAGAAALVDRAEFYAEAEVSTPDSLQLQELDWRLGTLSYDIVSQGPAPAESSPRRRF